MLIHQNTIIYKFKITKLFVDTDDDKDVYNENDDLDFIEIFRPHLANFLRSVLPKIKQLLTDKQLMKMYLDIHGEDDKKLFDFRENERLSKINNEIHQENIKA